MKTPSEQKAPCLVYLLILLFLSFLSFSGFSQSSDVEPNNSFETANIMSAGTLQSGTMSPTDLTDFFVSNSSVRGTLTIHVDATNTGPAEPRWFSITGYDQTTKGQVFYHDFFLYKDSSAHYSVSIKGLNLNRLYIQTWKLQSPDGSFSYNFSYQVTDTYTSDSEPNNDFSSALELGANQTALGTIAYISDFYNTSTHGITRDEYDYFKITSPVDGTLNVHLKIKDKEYNSGYLHYYTMVVYDAQGKQLYYPSNNTYFYKQFSTANIFNYDTLSFICKSNETYYVRVGTEEACNYELSYNPNSLPITVNFVNPNPNLISGDTISVNTSQIDTTQTITAAAADGITKLLLVTNASFPLAFSVANSDGNLSSLSDQKTITKQIIIEPDNNGKVVAVYTVPDGYGTASPVDGRNATITIANASNAGNYTTTSIKLVTPPVVMVHGMWSDPSIWVRNGFTTFLAGSGITNVCLADYSQVNASTFDPYSFESFLGRMSVQVQIDKALHDYQDKKIAVTQVDVVGHSLGGLMTRSLSQQSSFLEQRNYYKGFVHKLITMGTPHRGSPFGPELYKFKDSLTYYHVAGIEFSAPYPLYFIMQWLGMPIGDCHKDFGITSQGISDLSATLPYRTFAITANHEGNGIIPSDPTGYLGMEALSLTIFHKPFEEVMKSRCNTGVLPNDLIVPYKSQTGYISSTQTFYGTCHSIPGLVTETNNPLIQAKVAGLLLSDDTTEFSVGFPAPSSFPIESCDNASELIGGDQPVKKRETSNSLAGDIQPTGKEYVQISAPAKGSVYRINMDTVITVSYEPLGGAIPTNALLVIQDVGWYKLPTKPPYSTNITLPKNVKTGSLNMALIVNDTTGVNLVDTSHIIFVPSGILNNITIQPTSLLFDSLNRQTKMLIQEEYAGVHGTYLSDISSTADGITYATQKGNSIIAVAADGTITAVSAGIDTLIVRVGDSTFKVPVIVDNSFLSRTLYPNIIDFTDIPAKTEGDAPFALDATATSGNNVNFNLISGPAEIINGVVYIKGSGIVKIQATSAGNVYFDSAAPVVKTFYINSVLPLRLLTFTGSLINNDVLLNWATANEINTSYFIVERSIDGIGYKDIGNVSTVISNSGTGNYYFKDQSVNILSSSPVYYRLKEVDKDGKETLSKTIPITLKNLQKIIVYPNPAKRVINILLNQQLNGGYFKLFDMAGKEVLNQRLTIGLSQQVNLPTLSRGNYKIIVWNNGKIVYQQTVFVSI